jgi:prepilin-type N-terminal cleavage/methylation domain-containing protein
MLIIFSDLTRRLIASRDDDLPARGFTLIEVLIASILIAIVTTGLAFVFFAGKTHLVHIRSRVQAAESGEYFLTSMRNEVRQDQWGANCLQGSTCPDTYAPASQALDITFYSNYTITANAPVTNLTRVKLKVNWTEPAS